MMVTATLTQPAAISSDALYEVVDGVVVEKDVSAFAIWIANKLAHHLESHATTHNPGGVYVEMVFILDVIKDLRRRPDVAFVSAERWPLDRLPPFETDWAIVPDLAIEIISPSNTVRDLVRKIREYFQHGVREVWVIVPDERIVYVYRSESEAAILKAKDTLTSDLMPGWSMPVGAIIPEQHSEPAVNGHASTTT